MLGHFGDSMVFLERVALSWNIFEGTLVVVMFKGIARALTKLVHSVDRFCQISSTTENKQHVPLTFNYPCIEHRPYIEIAVMEP